jgi:hypothetical protein
MPTFTSHLVVQCSIVNPPTLRGPTHGPVQMVHPQGCVPQSVSLMDDVTGPPQQRVALLVGCDAGRRGVGWGHRTGASEGGDSASNAWVQPRPRRLPGWRAIDRTTTTQEHGIAHAKSHRSDARAWRHPRRCTACTTHTCIGMCITRPRWGRDSTLPNLLRPAGRVRGHPPRADPPLLPAA